MTKEKAIEVVKNLNRKNPPTIETNIIIPPVPLRKSLMAIMTAVGFGKAIPIPSYIPANKLNQNLISNPLTEKEAKLIKQSLNENTFRYDASELMERKIGADALWVALTNYIDMGRERAYREIEDITEELDSNF